MDFNKLKNDVVEKGKGEFSRREEELQESVKNKLGGTDEKSADGNTVDASQAEDLNPVSKKEIREPEDVEKEDEIKDPERTEDVAAVSSEADGDADADSSDTSDDKEEAA